MAELFAWWVDLTSLVEGRVRGIEPVRHDFSYRPNFQPFQHLVRRQPIHILEVCIGESGWIHFLVRSGQVRLGLRSGQVRSGQVRVYRFDVLYYILQYDVP